MVHAVKDWEYKISKLIGFCTDGVPAMTGLRSGLAIKRKEKNPTIVLFIIGKLWLLEILASKNFELSYKNCQLHQQQRFEQ